MKLDRSVPIFLLIGVGNTALNWAIMLVLNTKLGVGYWPASAIGFVVTSALSFILNRKYSFRSRGGALGDLWRFAVVIGICYLVAYAAARPFIEWALTWPALMRLAPWSDQIALLFGNVVFTVLNYIGQRFFAFARR